jgi:nucleotide-binding universal stress UspA family protein
MKPDVVVVGTDGSDQSFHAVKWAAREAVMRGAALRIVSVPVLPHLMSRQRALELMEPPHLLHHPFGGQAILIEECIRSGRYEVRAEMPGIDPQKQARRTASYGARSTATPPVRSSRTPRAVTPA